VRVPRDEDAPVVALLMSEHWADPVTGQSVLRRASLGVDTESPTGADRRYESGGMCAAARFDVHERSA
jgi:hypothetical protein